MAEALPIYQIKGKQYFRDVRLGEYRNVKDPSDRLDINIPNSMLQKPTLPHPSVRSGAEFVQSPLEHAAFVAALRVCKAYGIKGACDPDYIANVIKDELEKGAGQPKRMNEELRAAIKRKGM